MNQKLQQAILAARAGQNKEAQVLLTQVLKETPDEVQAWFLLSHLVDSEQKQIAYLKKVVALDPSHEKATERIAQLEPPRPVVEGALEVGADKSLDEALSEWTPETAEETEWEVPAPEPEPSALVEETISTAPAISPEPETKPAEDSMVEAVVAPTITPTATVETDGEEVDHQRQTLILTISLVGLVAAATIVFIALLYAIISAF